MNVKFQRYHNHLLTICNYCGMDCKKNTPRHFILHHADPALGGFKPNGQMIRPVVTDLDRKVITTLNLHPVMVPPNHPPCAHCQTGGHRCGKYRPCYVCIDKGNSDSCDPEFQAKFPKYEPYVVPEHDLSAISFEAKPATNSKSQPSNHNDPQPPPLPPRIVAPSKKPIQLRKYLHSSYPNLTSCPHTKPNNKDSRHECPWFQESGENQTNRTYTRCEESFALSYNLKVHYYAAHHDIYIEKFHPDVFKNLIQFDSSLFAKCPVCKSLQAPAELNRHWILEHVDKALGGFDIDGRSLQNDTQEFYDREDTMVLRVLGGFRWRRNGSDDEKSDSEDEGVSGGTECKESEGCSGLCGLFGGRQKEHSAVKSFFSKSKMTESKHHISKNSENLLDVTARLEVVEPPLSRIESIPVPSIDGLELDDVILDVVSEISKAAHDDELDKGPQPIKEFSTEGPETGLKRKRSNSSSETLNDPTSMRTEGAQLQLQEPKIVEIASPANVEPIVKGRRGSRTQKATPPATDEISAATLPIKLRLPTSPQSALSKSIRAISPPVLSQPAITIPQRKLKIKFSIPKQIPPPSIVETATPDSNSEASLSDIDDEVSLNLPTAATTSTITATSNKRQKKERIPSAKVSYECPWCQQGFRRKSDLQRHSLIHQSKRAKDNGLVCGQCGAVFSRNDALLRHEMRACKRPAITIVKEGPA
ncbi:hypothetical protein BDR26DRAFT_1009380 [Obelidium mucronatum]|nr:hypothetical protein BDR26DRAFT_1009380 [Obelidium mucronatum]